MKKLQEYLNTNIKEPHNYDEVNTEHNELF